jgi:ABC-type enterobactin transport system permease subunit
MFAGVADQQQKTGGAGPVGFLYKKLPLVKRRITRAAQCPLWVADSTGQRNTARSLSAGHS